MLIVGKRWSAMSLSRWSTPQPTEVKKGNEGLHFARSQTRPRNFAAKRRKNRKKRRFGSAPLVHFCGQWASAINQSESEF